MATGALGGGCQGAPHPEPLCELGTLPQPGPEAPRSEAGTEIHTWPAPDPEGPNRTEEGSRRAQTPTRGTGHHPTAGHTWPARTPRAACSARTRVGLDFEQMISSAHLCRLARESRGRAPHATHPGDTQASTRLGTVKDAPKILGRQQRGETPPNPLWPKPSRQNPAPRPWRAGCGNAAPRTDAPSGFGVRSRPSGGRLKG